LTSAKLILKADVRLVAEAVWNPGPCKVVTQV
jgi:hypothetical protein